MSQFLPPPEGYFWIRAFRGADWQLGYTDGTGAWWITGVEDQAPDPVEVGERIEKPAG